jgi:hypothetical protein
VAGLAQALRKRVDAGGVDAIVVADKDPHGATTSLDSACGHDTGSITGIARASR